MKVRPNRFAFVSEHMLSITFLFLSILFGVQAIAGSFEEKTDAVFFGSLLGGICLIAAIGFFHSEKQTEAAGEAFLDDRDMK